MLSRADDGAAEQIDEHDQDAGDRIAAYEFAGAVHGAIEVGFLAYFLAPDDGVRLRDDACVQVGIDRHLPSRHRIQGEACADLRDASRALGDHDKVDDDEHRKDHHAHRVIAADHEVSERGDDAAGGMRTGVPVHQDDACRGNVETEPQQGSAEQHRRKSRELECAAHIDHRQQDHQRQRNVEREEHIQEEGRQRQHHHGEHHHDEQRHA